VLSDDHLDMLGRSDIIENLKDLKIIDFREPFNDISWGAFGFITVFRTWSIWNVRLQWK
jgi:hypothetical protein